MNQDISKCNGIGCQIKESCQRFKAKRKIVDWFIKQDLGIVKEAKDCRFFYSLVENDKFNLNQRG